MDFGSEAFEKQQVKEREEKDECQGFGGRLRVVCGCLDQPDLGLGWPLWSVLASTVTMVIHCGAMVNWALPYQAHYSSNVTGTAHILALALYGSGLGPLKQKEDFSTSIQFCHISTLGLLCGGVLDEVCPTPTTGLSQKGGYAQVNFKFKS